jgi:hypothetical protein
MSLRLRLARLQRWSCHASSTLPRTGRVVGTPAGVATGVLKSGREA